MTDADVPVHLRADWTANRHSSKGRVVLLAFRATQAARAQRQPRLVGVVATALYRIIVDWVMGIDLDPAVKAGPGLSLYHGTGLVVHKSVVLGSDVVLRHGITIGILGDDAEDQGAEVGPRIGDRVSIGASAILLGPISVGDDSVIGAGSVVIDDVPAGAVVVGNPGRVVRVKDSAPR